MCIKTENSVNMFFRTESLPGKQMGRRETQNPDFSEILKAEYKINHGHIVPILAKSLGVTALYNL